MEILDPRDSIWTLNVWDGEASGEVVNGEYYIKILSAGTANSDIQLVQSGLFLENGKTYKVSFEAYAVSNRTMEVNVEMNDDPWTSYLSQTQQFDLTTVKQSFDFTFTMESPADFNGRLALIFGNSSQSVTIDNVSVMIYDPSGAFVKINTTINSPVIAGIKNSTFNIKFTAPENLASLKLYHLRGNLLKTALLKTKPCHIHPSNHDLSGLPNGYYIARICCGEQLLNTSRIMVTK